MSSFDGIAGRIFLPALVAMLALTYGSSDYFRVALGSAVLFGLLAAATDLSFGFAGILNLGSAMFYAIGAYAVALGQGGGLPFFALLLMATLAGGGLGTILGLVGLTNGRTSVQFGLLGLVLSLSLEQIIIANYTTLGGSNGIAGIRLPAILGVPLSLGTYLVLVITLSLAIVLALRLCSESWFGKLLLLSRDEPEKAESLGYEVKHVKVVALAISSACAALAGALYVPLIGIAYPGLFSVAPNMLVLVWIIIGGRGSLIGPFLGAFLFRMIEFEAGSHFANVYLLIVALVFLATVSLLPDGIASLRRSIARSQK